MTHAFNTWRLQSLWQQFIYHSHRGGTNYGDCSYRARTTPLGWSDGAYIFEISQFSQLLWFLRGYKARIYKLGSLCLKWFCWNRSICRYEGWLISRGNAVTPHFNGTWVRWLSATRTVTPGGNYMFWAMSMLCCSFCNVVYSYVFLSTEIQSKH